MKLSILIHNRNRGPLLARCLESVSRVGHRPLEAVVLDAGSTDDSPRVLEEYAAILRNSGVEVRIASCPMMGVAASRNHAAGLASGDLLLFLDNDAVIEDPESLGDRLVPLFREQPRLALVTFRILRGDSGDIDASTWVYRRPLEKWRDRTFRTFCFTGGGFCIRATAFAEAGGFWSHLQYSREEEELGFSLIHRGYDLLYDPGVTIRHYADASGRMSRFERKRTELRNGVIVLWRKLPMPVALIFIGIRLFTMSYHVVRHLGHSPGPLLLSALEAVREWNENHLPREPISLASSFTYFSLHFR